MAQSHPNGQNQINLKCYGAPELAHFLQITRLKWVFNMKPPWLGIAAATRSGGLDGRADRGRFHPRAGPS